MNHVDATEGFEVAIAALLLYVSYMPRYIYVGVSLPSRSIGSGQRLQNMVDSVLPELYAAVVVFTIKARTYFEARGM